MKKWEGRTNVISLNIIICSLFSKLARKERMMINFTDYPARKMFFPGAQNLKALDDTLSVEEMMEKEKKAEVLLTKACDRHITLRLLHAETFTLHSVNTGAGPLYKPSDKYIFDGGKVDAGYGYFWTDTRNDNNRDDYSVNELLAIGDNTECYDVSATNIGYLPAMHITDIPVYYIDNLIIHRYEDGKNTFELGYAPTKVAPIELQKKLEDDYEIDSLEETAYSYHLFKRESTYENKAVYKYNGKHYVRLINNSGKKVELEGIVCNPNESLWFEFVPQTWIYDDETKICVMEQLPFSGIPIVGDGKYSNFIFSDLKAFLLYFASDLIQFQAIPVDYYMESVELDDLNIGDCVRLRDGIYFFVQKRETEKITFVNGHGESLTLCLNHEQYFTRMRLE